jgi:hypothetical protein
MTPATYDFSVVRGSSGSGQGLKVRLRARDDNGDLVAMPFDDVRISIYDQPAGKDGDLLIRASIEEGQIIVTDEYSGEVTWEPKAAETRALVVGAKNFYELEVRIGTDEIVYMMGTITGIGGLNDDETGS